MNSLPPLGFSPTLIQKHEAARSRNKPIIPRIEIIHKLVSDLEKQSKTSADFAKTFDRLKSWADPQMSVIKKTDDTPNLIKEAQGQALKLSSKMKVLINEIQELLKGEDLIDSEKYINHHRELAQQCRKVHDNLGAVPPDRFKNFSKKLAKWKEKRLSLEQIEQISLLLRSWLPLKLSTALLEKPEKKVLAWQELAEQWNTFLCKRNQTAILLDICYLLTNYSIPRHNILLSKATGFLSQTIEKDTFFQTCCSVRELRRYEDNGSYIFSEEQIDAFNKYLEWKISKFPSFKNFYYNHLYLATPEETPRLFLQYTKCVLDLQNDLSSLPDQLPKKPLEEILKWSFPYNKEKNKYLGILLKELENLEWDQELIVKRIEDANNPFNRITDRNADALCEHLKGITDKARELRKNDDTEFKQLQKFYSKNKQEYDKLSDELIWELNPDSQKKVRNALGHLILELQLQDSVIKNYKDLSPETKTIDLFPYKTVHVIKNTFTGWLS